MAASSDAHTCTCTLDGDDAVEYVDKRVRFHLGLTGQCDNVVYEKGVQSGTPFRYEIVTPKHHSDSDACAFFKMNTDMFIDALLAKIKYALNVHVHVVVSNAQLRIGYESPRYYTYNYMVHIAPHRQRE